MLGRRVLVAGMAAGVLLSAGCSSSSTAAGGGATSSVSSAAAPVQGSEQVASGPALSTGQCLDLSEAHLDMITSNTKDSARTAADKLEKFAPPASAKDAMEHFVTTGGVQVTDPDVTANLDRIKKWIDQVCPT